MQQTVQNKTVAVTGRTCIDNCISVTNKTATINAVSPSTTAVQVILDVNILFYGLPFDAHQIVDLDSFLLTSLDNLRFHEIIGGE